MFDERFPQQFGNYTLLEKIGQGGMAEIFRAESRGSDGFVKGVAIKRILTSLASNEDFVTQFLDEARIAGSLSHPNIVQIYDVGQVDDAYFIAMEFVNGKHLGQMIRRSIESNRMVPLPVAVLVIKEVAQALGFAHSARDDLGNPLQIIHRDISPQNILVDFTGAIKLTDFGIAKAANKLFQTTAGVIKGKFSYLAPEQLVGHAASGASDLFSLGVVLWEMLGGRRLFQGESDIKTIQLVQACEVPPLQKERNDVPDELDDILRNLLAPTPQYRYQDANILVRDLSSFLAEQGISETPGLIADFMGSLYSERFAQNKGQPPTKASLPAISMDEYQNMHGQETMPPSDVLKPLPPQEELQSFEDALTPQATEAEMTNPGRNAWDAGPPTINKTPSEASQFDDIRTAAIDMSPLLKPDAFDDGGIPTLPVDQELVDRIAEAAMGGDFEATHLMGDLSPEETIPLDPEETVPLGIDGMEETLPGADNDKLETVLPPPPKASNKTFVIIVAVLVLACSGVWGTYFFLARKKRSSHIKVLAPKLPTKTTLQVEIHPPEAKVTLNGYPMTGKANLRTQTGLTGGMTYLIHASLKGYQPVRRGVKLAGKISRIQIKLKKQQ